MKQLLFCYKQDRKLLVRTTVLTDVFVPVEDVISPQKSTLVIPKNDKIELNDIVIIRDNDSGVVEYIGYIDTLTSKSTTEMSCYPLINVFDNDYVVDQLFEIGQREKIDENGNIETDAQGNVVYANVDVEIDAVQWLKNQLKRAFLPPERKEGESDEDYQKRLDLFDNLQALPLIIRDRTNRPVWFKKAIDTSNLFELYTDLFIATGVYVVFSGLSYNLNEIDGIYCDIYCNVDESPYYLRYDNPRVKSVDIVDNTFTNYNKIIATEELAEEEVGKREPKRYYFYLLKDNSITTNPNDPNRIKQVRSKELTFGLDENKSDKENANALLLYVYNELQAPEYNLKITIDMLYNDNIKLYRRVDFLAESGIMYSSNITKIEKLSDLQVKITLGALRNSLTDFKKKVEAI